ncbi:MULTISPECIES: nucleoside hydrolase [Rhizobium/Agrobacterium group]|uniref:Inosine-uridine preferring nucleoside hydrolase n=2 Tax=Rhizobium/Agrobacterium group TaxID=227290 RepID=B9JZK2_ALLAM|nr:MULTISPECIES: nucleoside hydrolase [Rhizobium/Agrobacterium group]ACM35314.1 inosine-uridine preferring nucleoside hydrolase [Allorhizobium ampelinum S4]MCF1435543.1 nucleoside hydrolase [Allorhizobium ampelinum]MCF1483314.1 nucleoside hydrolase [Allorhizobium ampelinum]MCF1493483.1 nucleoside hydrolase [Allorhizobium ampelinum]MUO28102.1 nucleoside hydrolase [Agrobacterium vitis]
MEKPRKIIIDTDPGQDDAAAIMLALASPDQLDVLGLTVVAGNVPLSMTSRNARIVCELSGRPDLPVYEGALKPLERPQVTAEHVHGKTGLDGAEVDEPVMPVQDQHAVDFIIDTIRREPAGTITLCTLGPQTNIALALQKAPDIAPRIRELVMMGGGFFEGGNITPAAEFNVYVDPQASRIVFGSGIPIVMMPLDVTHQLLTTKARVARIGAIGTRVAKVMVDWLEFFERFDIEKYGSDGGPLHDPSVIAYLLQPELFSGRDCNVEIETESELTVGMTVVDWWRVTGRTPNAKVMRDVDADGFFALLTERLARL